MSTKSRFPRLFNRQRKPRAWLVVELSDELANDDAALKQIERFKFNERTPGVMEWWWCLRIENVHVEAAPGSIGDLDLFDYTEMPIESFYFKGLHDGPEFFPIYESALLGGPNTEVNSRIERFTFDEQRGFKSDWSAPVLFRWEPDPSWRMKSKSSKFFVLPLTSRASRIVTGHDIDLPVEALEDELHALKAHLTDSWRYDTSGIGILEDSSFGQIHLGEMYLVTSENSSAHINSLIYFAGSTVWYRREKAWHKVDFIFKMDVERHILVREAESKKVLTLWDSGSRLNSDYRKFISE